MADVTFGVKVSPDLKEKIDQMIKEADFDTNKEWFENLLAVYELNQLKQQDGTKKYANDLESIEGHLKRIQELITAILKKGADDVSHLQIEWEQISDKNEKALLDSKHRCISLEEQLDEVKKCLEELKKEEQEYNKRITFYESSNAIHKKTLDEKESENIQLKDQLNQHLNANYAGTIQRMTEEYRKLERSFLEQKHELDLNRLEFEKQLEIQKAKYGFAEDQINFLLGQLNTYDKNPTIPETHRGRGRPRKDQTKQSSDNQEGNDKEEVDHKVIEHEDEEEPNDLPDEFSELNELLGDDPSQDLK